MRFLKIILLAVSLAFLCTACNRPPDEIVGKTGTFELHFDLKAGGVPFSPSGTFTNIQDRAFRLDRFQLYVSEIRLVRENGEELALKDAELFDFVNEFTGKTDHGTGYYRRYVVPVGNYKGVKFGFGVPSALNHSNPADYASTHPLSAANSMHWSWNSGYIFSAIEGKIDSSAARTGAPTLNFLYHTGLDTLYRTLDYTLPEHAFQVLADNESRFGFEIDLNRIFYRAGDTINMVTQNITQVTPVGSDAYKLSEKVVNNLSQNALYKIPF